MGKVKVLPQVLARQIAAGEIVERPASVIKELLENALDAEARRIRVEVEQGGRRSMLVQDDGVGMDPEDAQLAFEHHATSKISSLEDLERVATLGFRGEALPSIASVSRLSLRTVGSGSPLGTRIEYQGGELQGIEPIAWPRGTEVRVEDLFFNVPARRKFLKAPSTELGHISRQVTQYALAYPQVEFQFEHEGRVLLAAPAVRDLQERAYQVLGESFLEHLVPLDYKTGSLRVFGFTSLPHEQRSNAASLYLYVNRRMVKDRVLTHAVRLAYQDLIPSSAYPVSLIFLELPPEQVDVNVHPAKTEVRFRDSQAVHSAIYHGIQEALLRHRSNLSSLARPLSPVPAIPPMPAKGTSPTLSTFAGPLFPPPRPQGDPLARERAARPSDPHAGQIPETMHLHSSPVILGQFVESFIVAADRDGVFLIDQHVAHERILYDQARRQLEPGGKPQCQRLLHPLTVELSAHQKVFREQLVEELNACGFEVEEFGGNTLVVKGVPALARHCQVEPLLQELLQELQEESLATEGGVERLREKIAIGLSCRAAVKINTVLSPEKMQWMLDELFRCQNPYTCPHGRPILLRLGIEEVLKGFRRI